MRKQVFAFGFTGFWVLLLASCQPQPADPPEVVLAVTMPDLADRQPAVANAITEAFEALRTAHQGEDAQVLAKAYGDTGMLLHANAFLTQAEACYREAMRLDPTFFDWPYLMGYLASQNEAWQGAASWFQKAMALEPRYAATHMRLGRTYLQLGQFDEAEQEFRWILGVNPQSGAALFGLGRIAAERGDFATAAKHFETVITRMPEATAVYYPLAMAYRRLGDREKAQAALAQRGKEDTPFFDPIVVALEEKNATVEEAMRRGLAAMDANRLDRAEELLQRAVRLAPDDAIAHLNLGFLWLKKQRLDQAQASFTQALARNPNLVEAQTNLGVVAALRGQDEKARELFLKALELSPDFAGARVLLGNTLMRLGRWDEALQVQQMLMTQNPQDSRAFYYYGLMLTHLQRDGEARAHYERTLQRFPKQAELVEAFARLLACANTVEVRDGARALGLAEELFRARQTPSHAQTLAMALAETGKFSEAANLVTQALQRVDSQRFPGLTRSLERQRQEYSAGKPCRQAWDPLGPALKPGPP